MNIANMKKSETTEQILLFTWAEREKQFFPELNNMFHVPNEGKRTNGPVLKAAGMKDGVPDVFLLTPSNGFCGLVIEMKFGKNKTTKAQEDWLARLKKAGYKTAVCYGFQEARETVREYLRQANKPPMQYCEEAPKIFNNCCGSNDKEIYKEYCSKCQRKEKGQ